MIMTTVVAAIALGIAAQILAERLHLPAILPLLVLGMLAGPQFWLLIGADLPGLVHPSELGEGLEVMIHLGIALILFEGGLSLDPSHLRKVGSAVRNLLTVGVAITGVASAWAAHAILDMPWSTAALFGAIVTVTGPTVVQPLLRHMVVPRRVSTVLVSEGLIIDPIGAVLAYLVLLAIEREGLAGEDLLVVILKLTAIGAICGFAAGSAAKLIIRSRRAGGGELRNLTILALLLVAYLLAESQAPQSGILAAVVMGLTMAAADIPDLVRLKAFKGQLTILLISVLFILLAAQLDLRAIVRLGWGGVAVVAVMVLLIRPLSVFLSIPPRQIDLKGRSVIALTAPRGIVAAAVASLAARELAQVGIPGGPAMEGLVYLTIILTVLWATAMAVVLPRALGYLNDPRRRLTVLVGAHALSRSLAQTLIAGGRAVAIVDASSAKLRAFERMGARVVAGDARDASTFERAGVQRDTQVLALTTNDELNLLVTELVREEFSVEHPVASLQRPPEEFGRVRRAWVDLLGGSALDVTDWIYRLQDGRGRLFTVGLGSDEAVDTVRRMIDDERRAIPLVAWQAGLPVFQVDAADLEEESRQALTLLVSREDADQLAPFAVEPPGDDAPEPGVTGIPDPMTGPEKPREPAEGTELV
jgi:NhaP-type Na+/H+ or K+/H+ antiporter